jgi:hypothetical protein
MAYDNRGTNLPGIVAGADLTAAQHRFVSIDGTGRADLTGAGLLITGALENNPDIDQAASIQGPGSVVKIEASAAIVAGAAVASAANGQGVTAASGNYIAGECVEAAGAAGELCSVFLTFPGRLA